MKLKYYLRGLGTGIIFATLIMTVSSVIHNNNLSEEKIIKEAQKLGMIMPEEETEDSGLLASKKETESFETESSELETAQSTESTSEEPETGEPVTEPETPVSTEGEDKTYIQIQIQPGSTARNVAATLFENGLIENAEEFRIYMGTAGYAKYIHVGEFLIPVGATYEEICKIITN